MPDTYFSEISRGERFTFGANWSLFLSVLTEDKILSAENSLQRMLQRSDLKGMRFLDVGSGSGLFSLAARRLGAEVRSFDLDRESVACTKELRRRYFPDDDHWVVEEGSVLDREYLARLGSFDVVYSWGVLHHTGAMWNALKIVASLVSPRGLLYIAIYNDQGTASAMWLKTKVAYNRLRGPAKWLILAPAFLRLWGPTTVKDLFRGRPFHTWRNYGKGSARGMSPWRDVVDWVGGLPFEVAKPESIFDLYTELNYELRRLRTCGGGHGCNEFVFQRRSP